MIANSTNSNKVREFFSSRPETFYLTGSRFFQGLKDSATNDWDFFVADSVALEDALRANNFSSVKTNFSSLNTHYRDPSICLVMRGYIDGAQVDVQFTKPEFLEAKIKAQEKIKELKDAGAVFPFGNKALMRDIWRKYIDYYYTPPASIPPPVPGVDLKNKIAFIKAIRTYVGCGLAEAKHAADRFYDDIAKLKK